MEEIKEVSDLLKLVKGYSQIPSEMIYRGQNQDWELLPYLFRNNKETNLRIERELFKRLKLNKPLLPPEVIDSYDFLIFAQQHSMPTRLLDWTYSPLIALWFSCFNKENNFSNDGVIYIFSASSLSDARAASKYYNKSENDFKNHLDSIQELQKLVPGPLFERLTSQNGIFTVFPNSPNLSELNMIKVIIPSIKKSSILKELSKLNINEYTIFKDYDSFCKNLHWEVSTNKIFYQDKEPPEFIDIIKS